jgi:hypothetical protein
MGKDGRANFAIVYWLWEIGHYIKKKLSSNSVSILTSDL